MTRAEYIAGAERARRRVAEAPDRRSLWMALQVLNGYLRVAEFGLVR